MSDLPVVKSERKNINLCENNQTKPIQFAEITVYNGEYIQNSTFFKCKDYLNDVLWSDFTKEKITEFGFTRTGTEPKRPYNPSRLYMRAIEDGDRFSWNLYLKNVDKYLNNLEKEYGLEPTTITEVTASRPGTVFNKFWVVEGDPFWLKCSAPQSMYAWLLRCMAYTPTKERKMSTFLTNNIYEGSDAFSGTVYKDNQDFIAVMLSSQHIFTEDNPFGMKNVEKTYQLNSDTVHNLTGFSSLMAAIAAFKKGRDPNEYGYNAMGYWVEELSRK